MACREQFRFFTLRDHVPNPPTPPAGPYGYGFSIVRPGCTRGRFLLVTFQQWKVTKDCRGPYGGFGALRAWPAFISMLAPWAKALFASCGPMDMVFLLFALVVAWAGFCLLLSQQWKGTKDCRGGPAEVLVPCGHGLLLSLCWPHGPRPFSPPAAPWIWFFCYSPWPWRGRLLLVTFQQWKVTKDCRGSPGPQGQGWGYSPHTPDAAGGYVGSSQYRTLGKCRRWSMDKQNAQRHLSLRDSLGLSPTGSIMGPPGRRPPARRLANGSVAPRATGTLPRLPGAAREQVNSR